jgi:hypothetical protein
MDDEMANIAIDSLDTSSITNYFSYSDPG